MTTETKLTAGQKYDVRTLEFDRFVDASGAVVDGAGMYAFDWFRDGEYLGADQNGVEPLFLVDAGVTEFTHIYHDENSGWPEDGEVVLAEENGSRIPYRVISTSPIHTQQWSSNFIYLHCVKIDEDSVTLPQYEEYMQSCYVVAPISNDRDDDDDDVDESDPTQITLQRFIEDNQHVMVFVSGVGFPTGTTEPAGHPDLDWLDRIGILDLNGQVDEHGDWQWTGDGNPRDQRGNSILKVTAYVSEQQWKKAVADWEEDV
jgi:hypothetical protein